MITDSQIPVGQPFPMSGTWVSDFELPIPEFGSQLPTYVILFAIATLALLSTDNIQVPKDRSERQRETRKP
jgi:hypothetical protein